MLELNWIWIWSVNFLQKYKRGKLTRPGMVVNEGGWSHHRNNLQTGYNQYGSRCTWAYMTLSLNWRLEPFFFPICSLFHYRISTQVKREIIRYWSKNIMRHVQSDNLTLISCGHCERTCLPLREFKFYPLAVVHNRRGWSWKWKHFVCLLVYIQKHQTTSCVHIQLE